MPSTQVMASSWFSRKRQWGASPAALRAAPQQHLALQVQLLRGFVTTIHTPRRPQPFKLAFIQREPRRLPLLARVIQPQPREVRADADHMLLQRTRGVGVVDPQQECATGLLGQQPVVQRGADIADMQFARGAGRETGNYLIYGGGHAVRKPCVMG